MTSDDAPKKEVWFSRVANAALRTRRGGAPLTFICCVLSTQACGNTADGGSASKAADNQSAGAAKPASEPSSYDGSDSLLYQSYLRVSGQSGNVVGEGVGSISSPLLAPGAKSDTLPEYASKCDVATGIHVPAFNCDAGTEPPGQGTTPRGTLCDSPNVLNGVCDPGSKFQVVAQNPEAFVVAHCRKDGLPIAGSAYNDIAVIQYNKRTGATCFYQALGYASSQLDGANVAAPIQGESAWRWIGPPETEAIGCAGCHNNGPLVRSEYLAHVAALPSTSTGYDNKTIPLRYVGADYGIDKTWSIGTAAASNDMGAPCTSCHRLAVSNIQGFGVADGSGGRLAAIATAKTQKSKTTHGPASPIWMRPGQITYSATAEASALRFKECATGFWGGQAEGFAQGTAVAGCTFTPLGLPWSGFDPAQLITTL